MHATTKLGAELMKCIMGKRFGEYVSELLRIYHKPCNQSLKSHSFSDKMVVHLYMLSYCMKDGIDSHVRHKCYHKIM